MAAAVIIDLGTAVSIPRAGATYGARTADVRELDSSKNGENEKKMTWATQYDSENGHSKNED